MLSFFLLDLDGNLGIIHTSRNKIKNKNARRDFSLLDFSNSKFATEYSFSSPRLITRILSDSFSRQFCETKEAVKYAVVKTKGCCIYCGNRMYFLGKDKIPSFSNTIHYDHVYPASKMNLFEVGNVAIACSECNLEKSDKMPMDYYDQKVREDAPRYIEDRLEFEEFLSEFTRPYKEKWPEHYAAGTRIIEESEEFKAIMLKLLFEPVDISSRASKYNADSSVNSGLWDKVTKKAYELYKPLTAKDVEGRIGHTNMQFENKFGLNVKMEDITLQDLNEFVGELLVSKSESKNEFQKYRMLVKILVEVLNEEYLGWDLDEFYNEVPTFKNLNSTK